jgi:hypothetical protein
MSLESEILPILTEKKGSPPCKCLETKKDWAFLSCKHCQNNHLHKKDREEKPPRTPILTALARVFLIFFEQSRFWRQKRACADPYFGGYYALKSHFISKIDCYRSEIDGNWGPALRCLGWPIQIPSFVTPVISN